MTFSEPIRNYISNSRAYSKAVRSSINSFALLLSREVQSESSFRSSTESASVNKFALEGATEALWYEVRPWNIKVCLIQPGFINSDSFKNVKLTRESRKSIQDKNNPYHYHYTSMAPFIAKMMKLSPSTPEKIAKRIHRVLDSSHPPLRIPVTVDAYFFGLLRKLLPRFVYHGLMYYSLPRVFRWGEDDHYQMDAVYEENEARNDYDNSFLQSHTAL